MDQEFVFRFMSVRPANSQKKLERTSEKAHLYAGGKETRFGVAVTKALGSENRDAIIKQLAQEMHRSERYVRSIADLPFDVHKGLQWAQENVTARVEDPAVQQRLAALYDNSVSQIAASAAFRDSLDRVADTLLAEALDATHEGPNLDQLATAHKLLVFIDELASGGKFTPQQTVADLVGRRTLILKAQHLRHRPPAQPAPPPAPPAPPPVASSKEETAKARLAELEAAHREVSELAVRPDAVTVHETEQDAKESYEGRIAELERRLAECEQGRKHGEAGRSEPQPASASLRAAGRLAFTRTAAESLSDGTRRVLADLKIDARTSDPAEAVGILERQMNALGSQIASSQKPRSLIALGGVLLDRDKVADALALKVGPMGGSLAGYLKCELRAGISDLLMVRQKLKAYELGDFAHVENVLAGETREREHRRLDLREDTRATEEETITEKEKDLQSTQRNEVQTEAARTVKQQFGLEAGLQISGSYGPMVQFAAHLNASFSTTSEETQRKAVSFSQEVTEKTSERVSQRVKQTATQRVLQEIQEINKHSFVNASTSQHIRGIYRWLNKVYDAQLFNYGQRMMYEFVVPEPAAYFLYAMVENPPQDSEIVKPDPPSYSGSPLRPDHLSRANYLHYVATYQVRAVQPPPPQLTNAAYFDKQDGGTENNFGRSSKIDLPDGYEAYGTTVMSDSVWAQGLPHLYRLTVGGQVFDQSLIWGAAYKPFPRPRRRELAIEYELMQTRSFALGVDVHCQLSVEGFAKWQQQVYDAIIEAYQRQQSEYEEKMAALAIQKGPVNLGRNPFENQRIAKDELKKLVLMMLTGSTSIALDSFQTSSSEPRMEINKACLNGARIRFFEHAFEWTNMLYVLYPYFWGRHARWQMAIHLTDPDPEFAAFLRAGAARVQVPVRPGFEKAVAHFCQFNTIWNGNDPPLIDDDLYVPIVDEIASNLGKFEKDAVPYPEDSEPWEVRVPTELVLVQNLDEIPNIRDILTGHNVSLGA